MEYQEFKWVLENRPIKEDSFLEITLEDGSYAQGIYSRFGEQGGINLYTSKKGWTHYSCEKIRSMREISANEASSEMAETMREFERDRHAEF